MPSPTKRKMVNVPLRLEGDLYRTMLELSELVGIKVDTVVSVLVAVGFLTQARQVAVGLKARAAEIKKAKRRRK